MSRTLATAALLIAALPVAAHAKGVERFANSGPGGAIILQSVSVPAGTDMLYLSGQVAAPIDPRKAPAGEPQLADYGDTRTQTVSALNKIKGILESHGFSMHDVIKLTVFIVGDPALNGKMDFSGMNTAFKGFFGTTDNPITVARSTVQVVALASPAFLVEIEATAAKAPGTAHPADTKAATTSTKTEPAKSAPAKATTPAKDAAPKKSSATH
jgi:enamine deaminase RidA (YjgF/YER057c/UK114 family)